jgi:glycosyltransferase involved in cell wall biosynthesis
MNVLFVVPCSPYFPSGTVRVEQFFPYISAKGISYQWFNFNTPRVQRWLHWLDRSILAKNRVTNLLFRAFIHATGLPYRWYHLFQIVLASKKFDLLFFQSILLPVWFSVLLKRLNSRIVFDFDDALYLRNANRTKKLTECAWRVVVGSHELKDYATQFNPNVILIPSAVQIKEYSIVNPKTDSRPLRIGWIGGTSTLKYLAILEEPLRNLAQKGFTYEFLIAGTHGRKDLIPQFTNVKVIDVASYKGEDIPHLVTQFDIGVMPMWDGPWERAKCAMKAIIYMAGSLPSICSPVGENNYVVEDGQNGFLAATTQEWEEKLSQLFTDPALRMRLGKAGRELVAMHYSDEACFRILEQEIFDQL